MQKLLNAICKALNINRKAIKMKYCSLKEHEIYAEKEVPY